MLHASSQFIRGAIPKDEIRFNFSIVVFRIQVPSIKDTLLTYCTDIIDKTQIAK